MNRRYAWSLPKGWERCSHPFSHFAYYTLSSIARHHYVQFLWDNHYLPPSLLLQHMNYIWSAPHWSFCAHLCNHLRRSHMCFLKIHHSLRHWICTRFARRPDFPPETIARQKRQNLAVLSSSTLVLNIWGTSYIVITASVCDFWDLPGHSQYHDFALLPNLAQPM